MALDQPDFFQSQSEALKAVVPLAVEKFKLDRAQDHLDRTIELTKTHHQMEFGKELIDKGTQAGNTSMVQKGVGLYSEALGMPPLDISISTGIQKNLTPEQIAAGTLEEKLGRKPTYTEIDTEMKSRQKGYDTEEEAFTEAQRMVSKAGKDAGLVPSVELSAGNKWIPKPVPNITLRIPPNQMVPDVPGLTFNRKTNTFSWAKVPEGGANQQLSDIVVAQKAKKTLQTDYARTGQVIKESQMDAQTLLGTSDAFKRSNYPAPNKLITMTGEQIGDQKTQAEIGRLKIALLAFSRKYMRVVTGAARSVAELSVGAQDTAETVLSKFDSWSTLEAKVKQAQQEIKNTDTSYKDQFDELNKIITGKSEIKTPAETEKPTATHRYVPGKGIVEIK